MELLIFLGIGLVSVAVGVVIIEHMGRRVCRNLFEEEFEVWRKLKNK